MPGESSRVVGIDVARGLAIVGMFVAHTIPRFGEGELLVDGRSSILFATLAGVSLGIMTGSTRPLAKGSRNDRLIGITLRAMVLFVLGVTLSTLGSGIAIILDYYAIIFMLVLPLLFMPRRILAIVAVVLLFAAPFAASIVDAPGPPPSAIVEILEVYFLTGYYPALVWVPFLLVGIIAARSDLRSARTQGLMMLSGGIAAALGYGAALVLPGVSAAEHSGSTAEVLGSGGVAIAVIGAVLWITSDQRGSLGSVSRGVLWPLGAIGSMALTVYTLQILALALINGIRDSGGETIDNPGWPLLIGMTIASLVFASLWKRFLGRGPLERAIRLISQSGSAKPVPVER
ncbi:DUF418 domain-containing protein [Marisediminicola senii]|uniref:DUF418 domain-containing protein n=1 Tax=Marisediminicola senii TaxID=2711233 RepID=UPI0013EBBD36|nr:DUF418 domain-containing protein [Marisediminicola senii]